MELLNSFSLTPVFDLFYLYQKTFHVMKSVAPVGAMPVGLVLY